MYIYDGRVNIVFACILESGTKKKTNQALSKIFQYNKQIKTKTNAKRSTIQWLNSNLLVIGKKRTCTRESVRGSLQHDPNAKGYRVVFSAGLRGADIATMTARRFRLPFRVHGDRDELLGNFLVEPCIRLS